MSTKVEIVVEVVRGENPLAPARGSGASEALVDEFMQALAKEAAPEPDPEAAALPPEAELLDMGVELVELAPPEHAAAPAPPLPGPAPTEAPAPAPAPAESDAEADAAGSDDESDESDAESDDGSDGSDESEEAAEIGDESDEAAEGDATIGRKRRAPRNVQERIRGLNAAEQQKLARMGEQRERVVLERMYGKNVWESLLRNPKLTPPEAARIARMGALPLPLLELIVNNRAWLSSPQVRRALLSNPRLKKDMVATVLRATPKNELKLMPKQMAYPATVRQAATRMLK